MRYFNTESEARHAVIDQAILDFGAKEGGGAHLDLVHDYNTITPHPRGYTLKTTDSWCAAAVTVWFNRAGIIELIVPECGCEEMMKKMIEKGIVIDLNPPEEGDVVFYNWDSNPDADHVGIARTYNDHTNIMKVIEGNKNDAVDYRTIALSDKFVKGIAHVPFWKAIRQYDYENLGWNKDSKGWWYAYGHAKGEYHKNNAVRINNDLYFFDTEGYCVIPTNIQCEGNGAMKYIYGERVK